METMKKPKCPKCKIGGLDFAIDHEVNGKEFYVCDTCGKWFITEEIDLTFLSKQMP